jgi:outer membrane protein assembly factor BamB
MVATAGGDIPLSVNVYNSNSPAVKVSFSYSVNGGAWSKPKLLDPLTDWNWQAAIPATKLKENDQVTLIASAQFGNGEVQKQRKRFVYDAQPAPVSLGDDWTNLLGNAQHMGMTAATFAPPQQLAWSTNVKGNIYMNSPLIANNKIYVATVDENLQGNASIHALDAQTGALCWKYTVRNSIKNSLTTTDGMVFAQDADGYLYAVDAATGTLVWEKKLATNPLPALIEGVVSDKGTIYAGTGKGLTAVDAQTGKSHWTNTAWGQAEGTTSTPSVGNGVLVTGSQWRGLYAHDTATGKLLWSKGSDGLSDRGASAAIHGDLVYITSRASLFILNLHTGKTIARKALPYNVDVTSTPLVTEKAIIFGTFSTGLVAVDRETFEPLWQFELPEALVYTAPYTRGAASTVETSPVLVGSTVYFGSSDGAVYGVDCVTGKAVWKHQTGAPVFSTVAVSGNLLVAADFSGNVYAFTGSKK